MHAAAVDPEDGLGHEGGIDPVDHGDGLDRGPHGHDLVGHGQGFVIAHVDFVLGRGHFVVAVLHPDTQFLHGEDGVAPEVVGHIQRRGVEIAAGVQDLGAGVIRKVKVFQLRTQERGVAFLRRLGQHALQGVAGVAGIRGAVGLQDVAEHPGHRPLIRAPGQDLEGGGVGLGDHVAFLNAGKSLNGGSVEPHAFGHSLFQLGRADSKTLHNSQNVREPDLDKADFLVPNDLENILYRLAGMTVHDNPPEIKIIWLKKQFLYQNCF